MGMPEGKSGERLPGWGPLKRPTAVLLMERSEWFGSLWNCVEWNSGQWHLPCLWWMQWLQEDPDLTVTTTACLHSLPMLWCSEEHGWYSEEHPPPCLLLGCGEQHRRKALLLWPELEVGFGEVTGLASILALSGWIGESNKPALALCDKGHPEWTAWEQDVGNLIPQYSPGCRSHRLSKPQTNLAACKREEEDEVLPCLLRLLVQRCLPDLTGLTEGGSSPPLCHVG